MFVNLKYFSKNKNDYLHYLMFTLLIHHTIDCCNLYKIQVLLKLCPVNFLVY